MRDCKINLQMTNYSIRINSIVRPTFIAFILFWNVFVVFNILQNPRMEYKYLFAIFGLLMTLIVIKQLFGKLEINITDNTFIVKYVILKINIYKREYIIREINNLDKVFNSTENTTFGGQGFLLNYKTPVTLSFNYRNEAIEVGKTFNWPEIDDTLREIKKRK